MKIIKYKQSNCEIKKSHYSTNGNLALVIIDEETGEFVLTITINLGEKLEPDMGYVRDYASGKGIMDVLKEYGLIDKILKTKKTGYVEVSLVKFNLDGVEKM